MSGRIHQLNELGQSIWCDFVSRRMIDSGELQRLIDLGVVGVTSNPTIFMKAITSSTDYDKRLAELASDGKDTMAIYEGLVISDIADAADVLRPVFDRTDGVDGYVSLEVSPKLAYDTDGTIAEGRRLFAELDRRNVFIKVPATEEGLPAIRTLIGEGINVNVTLIFSLEMYDGVMQAYIDGLKALDAAGGDISKVASVASFFISRVDSLVDKRLSELGGAEVRALQGKAAVANARLAYAQFAKVFDSAGEFGKLAKHGAGIQRPLWASTSTKNPEYPDTKYVDELIGSQTVNTLPPQTIDAVLDHGRTEETISDCLDEARELFDSLRSKGIDMADVTAQLLKDGVALFDQSFDELLANLSQKQEQLATAN